MTVDRKTKALLGLAMAALAAALCINLNAPFFGSFETQAAAQTLPARNHLRYGFGTTKGLASFAPGGLVGEDFARHWWIHHPPLAPLGTTVFFALFGESTASARLSGILWAVLAIPLVWLAARKLESPVAGWWAILAYAAAGLTLWDARRPEYFQPALFLLLLSLVLYLSWIERPSRWRWAGAVAAVALGCWVDWTGYILGAALAVHMGLREGRARWRRGAVLLVILVACFGVSLLHVRWVAGPEAAGYLAGLFLRRTTGLSRLTAMAVLGQACLTYIGIVVSLASVAALAVRGGAAPAARTVLWALLGYGLAASQVFLEWTNFHAYVAAWFVFPALVLISGIGLARMLPRIPSARLRRATTAAAALAIAGQGVACAVYRHRQDTWYKPDREVIRVLKENVPPRSWVATPLRGLSMTIETYETDCNIFFDMKSGRQIREVLARGRPLHVLLPLPDAPGGSWEGLSRAGRERMGVVALDTELMDFLSTGDRKDLGPYRLYRLAPP